MVSGVIDTRDEVAIAFGVRGPEHNDAVQLVVLLERTNILANMLDVLVLVASRDKVISTGFLVGSDEVWVVYGREWGTDVGHVGGNLALKVIVEHLGTVHRLVHGHTRNVPTSEDEVVRVHHRKHFSDWNVDVLARGIAAEAHSRRAQ